MRILYVCHRFPFPPKRGGKIRPFNMIRHLGRSHEVTVCSLVRSEVEATEGEGLAAYCTRYEMVRVHDPVQTLRMVARLPTTVPSSFGFFHSAALKRRIDAALAREREARRAVDLYATTVRELARQNVDILLEGYDLGRIPLTEVLTAQRQYLEVEAGYTAALSRAYEASTAVARAFGETR
jgi:hypothetical protein